MALTWKLVHLRIHERAHAKLVERSKELHYSCFSDYLRVVLRNELRASTVADARQLLPDGRELRERDAKRK